MLTINQKRAKALDLIRAIDAKIIYFWCGYCIVTVFNKHLHYRKWLEDIKPLSDLDCIDKCNGKILFMVDFYFDNGYISEFNRCWAFGFEEAARETLTFTMLENLKGVFYA